MRGRLLIDAEGVELRGRWRHKWFAWNEIRIFRVREYTSRGVANMPLFFYPRPSVWLVTNSHDWHRIIGMGSEDQVHQLNEAVDEGRVSGSVDMEHFAGPEWANMRGPRDGSVE